MMTVPKTPHPDELKREAIPTLAEYPTLFRPEGQFLMLAPLPDLDQVGQIILPNQHKIQYDEGHILAVGPNVPPQFKEGNCVCWQHHTEVRFEIEGKTFVIVNYVNVVMMITKESLEASARERSEIDLGPKLNLPAT